VAHSRSPRLRVHRHLLTCLISHAYHRASQRPTSTMSSSAIRGGGEDSRITINHHHERRRNIEGAISSEILNLLRLHEKRMRRMSCTP
jgi:hypothetical protein